MKIDEKLNNNVGRYVYTFESQDEDGLVKASLEEIEYDENFSINDERQNLVSFLSQTNDAYLDNFNIVHEVYNGVDQLYSYQFDIEDGDWYEQVGILGELLDDGNDCFDSSNEYIRKAVEQMYTDFSDIANGTKTLSEVNDEIMKRNNMKFTEPEKESEYDNL